MLISCGACLQPLRSFFGAFRRNPPWSPRMAPASIGLQFRACGLSGLGRMNAMGSWPEQAWNPVKAPLEYYSVCVGPLWGREENT